MNPERATLVDLIEFCVRMGKEYPDQPSRLELLVQYGQDMWLIEVSKKKEDIYEDQREKA